MVSLEPPARRHDAPPADPSWMAGHYTPTVYVGAPPIAFITDQKGHPAPNELARYASWMYTQKAGMRPVIHDHMEHPNSIQQAELGAIYEAMPADTLDDPKTALTFEIFALEVAAQLAAGRKHGGMRFEEWYGTGYPYYEAEEVAADVARGRMYYKRNDSRGMRPALARMIEVADRFNAVHDYYGHAAGGFGFGPTGEYNAWINHTQMFSPTARRAATTLTRARQAWVAFGPHLWTPDRKYREILPADRPDSPIKFGLVPARFSRNRYTDAIEDAVTP